MINKVVLDTFSPIPPFKIINFFFQRAKKISYTNAVTHYYSLARPGQNLLDFKRKAEAWVYMYLVQYQIDIMWPFPRFKTNAFPMPLSW